MPTHTTITDGAATKFKLPTDKEYEDHFDASHPGLALRVRKTGLKVWTYFFRLKNGKVVQRRMSFGPFPSVGVAEAHEAWRKARDMVQAGRDPTVADSKLPVMSFEGVFEEWIKRDQIDKGNKSAKSIRDRFRNHILPAWQGRLISDIDRRAALDVIDAIADTGKVIMARRVFGHLHRLFVWAVGRGIIEVNPLQHAEKPGSETSRERVLSDAELVKVWNAADELSPSFRDAFRLLVLTGARKNEVSGLRWDELADGVITLEGERTKNGQPHVIPLSSTARAIVTGREHKNGYTFPGEYGGPITNWLTSKRKLDAVSGVDNWTIHDLRRTVATGLQKLGVQLVVTEAVLGHSGGSRGGIVKIYQRHDYAAEKAAALEAWAAHVMSLVEGSVRGKVLPISRRG